jgi:ABC transporter
MITLSKVSKWYPNFQVLNHCSTEVAKGEVVVVRGPSGSGKSTLIKCVNGGGTLPALFGLSRTQLPAAMDMLSGEGVSGTQETALGAAGMFTSIMMDQGAFWRDGGNRRHTASPSRRCNTPRPRRRRSTRVRRKRDRPEIVVVA